MYINPNALAETKSAYPSNPASEPTTSHSEQQAARALNTVFELVHVNDKIAHIIESSITEHLPELRSSVRIDRINHRCDDVVPPNRHALFILPCKPNSFIMLTEDHKDRQCDERPADLVVDSPVLDRAFLSMSTSIAEIRCHAIGNAEEGLIEMRGQVERLNS
ncbi:hypothetical protein KCU98_g74, partial [Aureobasidium melanogenum]